MYGLLGRGDCSQRSEEPGDVPNFVRGFSRVGSGFRHDRTPIDTFTAASIYGTTEIAALVIGTATLSENIRVVSGLVALKLFS